MLITAKSADEIPAGTAFFFSEDGLQVGGDMPEDGLLICESLFDIPPATEFFVTLGFGGDVAGVSLEPPPNMVCVTVTREDILRDDFLSLGERAG